MSLSDYSCDDSLDEEPALGVEAIKSVARSARTGGPSSMNTSNKSLAAAALAGIAVAGIAAGSLLLRKYFKPSGTQASRADGNIQGSDAQDTSDRKDLRRKRPVGGDVKESPRQSAPFMTRTESTSSVGPLRKQPRRETSEDSEGGDASGASPKGGTADGHRRPLRKTSSANSRHRRPPRRGAGPSASSPAGTGSESESNRAERAAAAKREAAPQPLAAAAAGAPAAPAAAAKPAPEKAGPAAPTDLMAKHRGGEPSAVAPQEASRGAPESGGKVPKAESFPDLVAPTISAKMQPPLDTFTAEMDVLAQAVESAKSAKAEAGSKAAAAKEQAGSEPNAKAASPADAKGDGTAAADKGQKEKTTEEESKEASKADAGAAAEKAGENQAAAKDVSKMEAASGKATKGSSAAGEQAAGEEESGAAAAGKEKTPAEAGESGPEADSVAALQQEIDAQDELPAAKDLVSPAVADNDTAAAADGSKSAAEASPGGGKAASASAEEAAAAEKEAAAEGGSCSTGKGVASPDAHDQSTTAKKPAQQEQPAAANAADSMKAEAAGQSPFQGSGKGDREDSSRALSSEPSLLPDGRATTGGGNALEEQANLDLSSAEADAVSRAAEAAAEQPADGDASAPDRGGEKKFERVDGKAKKDREAGGVEGRIKDGSEEGEQAQESEGSGEIKGKGKDGTAEVGKSGNELRSAGNDVAGIEAGSVSKAAEEPAASQSEAASANGSVHSTENRADGAKADAAPKTSKLDAKAAPFDPLGMDAEANDSAEVSAQKEAGNGHVAEDNQAAAGEEAGSLDPQNQAESNVDLNLAVALRIVSEKGNLAAAERTLQKSLGTVREAGADPVRPHFRSRLAGTLADIIARADQTAAMAPGKNKKDNAVGRRAEIVDLLSYAFEAAKETGDGGLRARESWRLGAALAEAEDFEAAHALFQEELAHWEERAGPADPRTQHSRTWLADVLVKLGRKEEAHKLLTDAAESLEKEAERAASSKPEAAGSGSLKEVSHGEDSELPGHDLTPAAAASVTAAKCYVHLATMQDADGEFDAAAGNARKAVTIMEGTFGEASPRASTAYGTLASVLKHQGKEEGLREALGLYETLQRIAEAVHGLRNSHAAMAHRAIADVHLLLNEHGEAVSHTEKAVQVAGAVHGRDHPVMESYWQAVAEAKQAAGDKEGAKDASRQALRVRSHSQRGGHGGGGGGGRGGRGGGGSAGRRGRGRR